MRAVQPDRGMITDDAKTFYREALGRELTQVELRLMPFIQYTVINEGVFDGRKVNRFERAVLNDLESAGLLLFRRVPSRAGMYRIAVSEKYWDAMCDVLKICYVWRAITE